ncbi:MAG: alpha/beta hydrolase [Porticoccaceae bacterium]
MSYLLVLLGILSLPLLIERLIPNRVARFLLSLDRRLSGLKLKTCSVRGQAMPYLEGGRGDPLVLIHGFAGDKDNFTRVARFLVPHYRVIIPDLPGFGEAGRDPNAGYTMADQVDNLTTFLDRFGVSRVHLGGSSMGGFIAAQMAGTVPDRVASLWLLDAAGTGAAHGSEMLQKYQKSGDVPLLVRTEADFKKLMATATHKVPFMPFCVSRYFARRAMNDYPLHSKIMAQLAASPLLEQQFSTIDVPALIVWGEEDQMLDLAGASALHVLLPDSRVRIMHGTGHMPMLEFPAGAARDYLDFRSALS